MGLCPTPHKLLKKFNQNFTRNRANARFPFIVFGQAFFKKLVGWSQKKSTFAARPCDLGMGEAHGFIAL